MTPFEDDDDGFPRTTISLGKAHLFAAAEAMGHYLVVVDGADSGRVVEVGAAPVTIGREAGLELVFADTELSRRHARVSLIDGAFTIADLRSTNGTFVDGTLITAPTIVQEGGVIRIGRQVLTYERRSRRDVERNQMLVRDLANASSYVLGLIPPPIERGPVTVSWRFQPSVHLGGDAFGYWWLDADTFVVYLIDVSGHGVGAAMHSVTVMNVLRQRALPQVDFADPAAVLSSLNTRFQMDSHNGMYFTMWYGVYRVSDRTLICGAAGHHAAYLVPRDKTSAESLGVPNLMIGAVPELTYDVQRTQVPEGSTLYLFSDGVFEIVTAEGQQWRLRDFRPLVLEPTIPGVTEPDRLYAIIRTRARPGLLDDDFSLMAVAFR